MWSRGHLTGGCEKFAGATEEEIGFGDFEAVGGAHHGLGGARGLRQSYERGDEDAVGFLRARPMRPRRLVELGEAEALGVFDDHDGRWDVDADFHDGGGDENLRFVFAERCMTSSFSSLESGRAQEALALEKLLATSLVLFHGRFIRASILMTDNDVAWCPAATSGGENSQTPGRCCPWSGVTWECGGREFVEDRTSRSP